MLKFSFSDLSHSPESSFTSAEVLRGLAHLPGGDGLGQLQHGSQTGAETSPDSAPHGGTFGHTGSVLAASVTLVCDSFPGVTSCFISGNGIQLGREFKGLRNTPNNGEGHRITL